MTDNTACLINAPHNHDHVALPMQSVLGQRWEWRCEDERAVSALSQHIPELEALLARILVGRGQDVDKAMDYLAPSLRNLLPDPLHLRDMDKAVARLMQAIEGQEKIAVFGDYDVDGASSSALISRFLTHLNVPNEI